MTPLADSPANEALRQRVHPADWTNPTPPGRYNLVVIGGGTAGLVTAAGAAGIGARVALVERNLLGGDCLNVGCVPSKGVIAAGRAVADVRRAAAFGVTSRFESIDFAAALERMRRLRADIAENDSAERFSKLGVDVYLGQAAFDAEGRVHVDGEAGERTLEAARTVLATGARAAVPDVPGLREAKPLTNETVFTLTEPPERLLVLGGGPIGSELAQSFARLGVEVVQLERSRHILGGDDPAAAAIVQKRLVADGVDLRTEASLTKVEPGDGNSWRCSVEQNGRTTTETVSHILVAVGRQPNVEGLNLEAVGVAFDERAGVQVDERFRTTNPNIYACGDICSPLKFTHAADFMARAVVQNALVASRIKVAGWSKRSALLVPHATYTSPEIAGVGQTATAEGEPDGDCYEVSFADVDRAILEGETEGFVKIWTKRGSDRIIGATVVAEHAGDLISEITVAMKHKIGLGQLAGVIHPYPTQAEAIRKAGDAFNKTRLTPLAAGALKRFLAWTR